MPCSIVLADKYILTLCHLRIEVELLEIVSVFRRFAFCLNSRYGQVMFLVLALRDVQVRCSYDHGGGGVTGGIRFRISAIFLPYFRKSAEMN